MCAFEFRDRNINSEEMLSLIKKRVAEKMKDKVYREDIFLEDNEENTKAFSAATEGEADCAVEQSDFLNNLHKSYPKLCQSCDPWLFRIGRNTYRDFWRVRSLPGSS